jgi:hypothetical protein
MAYDETLAQSVREALAGRSALVERRMFGGLAFMLHGNMCCGVLGDDLILRLGPEGGEAALNRPHARPFDVTGRPMKGIVMVAPAGHTAAADLNDWVGKAVAFALSLPPK